MSQWGQGQPGYQYPLQTGFPGQNQTFQQPGFPQGGLAPQPTGYPGQRPPFQQPQQTGYPGAGGGLLPQQTGYPGSFQPQQRPPIPPVPPLPSQFQQQAPPPPPPLPQSSNLLALGQQNRFAGSSPAFGNSGFTPQQTGYPGQGGGGLQPLAPQVTGFVDPRLQMMSNTFLPANLAAPYNPAGAPQLLQPLQQLGGLSLQQSFQQHNQEVKGTAAPAVPWTLSKGEKKSYDSIFRAWDATNTGFIDGKTAIEVFGQSGLDKNDLARIWTLADVDNRGKLNIAEFHVAMGLIYRKLNGNEIPDELPAELVPPSHRDLDTSVNFVKNLLQNEPSRARSPSGLDAPVSRLPNRSLHSTSAPGAGGRQDATVYKHTDVEPAGGYYTPRSRHVDRSAVRATSEQDSPSADLDDMKRRLESTARMLDRATEESALHTAEDDALEREMSDLKWKVKRVQEDLEYVSRGPRSHRADEERRRLERELLDLMHDRVPAVEKKLAEREERRERQKRDWDRERDRRNDTFGRFDDRDRDRDRYGGGYSRNDDRDRYGSSYDRDRDRDRDYRDDRSRDFDRDRSYRARSPSPSRDRDYDRERKRSPPITARSPPPPPPPAAPVSSVSKPPPAPPAPGRSPAPNTKNMTPEQRRAFIQAEAQRRTAERMAAMGLSGPPSATTPKSTLDTSTEDRLAREKKEAEEKARAAEEAASERARQRDERVRNERGGSPSTPASPAAKTPSSPAKAPPAVKPRAPAPPPPRRPSQGVPVRAPAPPKPVPAPAIPKPVPPPAPPVIDHEEEELRVREATLRKQKEERLARLRRLEEEEKEEEAQRQRDEAARLQMEQEDAARKVKQERLDRLKRLEEEEAAEARREEEAREARRARTPAPVAPPAPPPAPPVPPAPPATTSGSPSPADRGKNNPFNRLMSGGAPSASPTPSSANGGNNPFFRSQPAAPPATAPTPPAPAPPAPPAFVPPPASKSPAPPVIKTSYHTAPGDSDDEWGQEKDGDDDDDSSDDEINSSRDTRDRLARQLFGSILPSPAASGGPARPQSAAAGLSRPQQDSSSPTAFLAPTPPPPPPSAPPAPTAPPPPPMAPPPPAAAAGPPAPAGDRGALLNAIQGGARLRKAVTNDRSGSSLSGRVIGDAGPPAHVSAAASNPPPEPSHASRQSVDWYMGLAADQDPHASREPSLPSMGEEEEGKEANGHAVPEIQIAHAEAEEAQSDPLADVDRNTEYRVRSLYPYEGQRAEDLSFGENLVIVAHPSKTGGDWWYGTVVSSGKAGFFPKTYVQDLEAAKAKGLYDYPGGSADELPFSEGDEISIVDRSDSDWYKAEKDGVIFIVPAAYLEITEG